MFSQLLIVLLLLLPLIDAHGVMAIPRQRGIQGGSRWTGTDSDDKIRGIEQDFHAHFPAGDKGTRPGSGKRSQMAAARNVWRPFEPENSSFRWRAGVCGDLKTGPDSRDHLAGGRFHNNGQPVMTYLEGGILEVTVSIIAHHNGYFQVRMCDVSKCGGTLNEDCFSNGHCPVLERVKVEDCQQHRTDKCGPIDTANPGRWYLPCTNRAPRAQYDSYGGKYARFQLPARRTGNFVLHWFWTGANNCNPPGVLNYFTGPDKPQWGKCVGQAGAIGGFTEVQNDCGGVHTRSSDIEDSFPEEYMQCADIEIRGASSGRTRPPTTTADERAITTRRTTRRATRPRRTTPPRRTPNPPRRTPRPTARPATGNPFKYFAFVSNGLTIRKWSGSFAKINIKPLRNIALRIETHRNVAPVEFYIDGNKVWTENHTPYFLYGDNGSRPNYFGSRASRYTNKTFKLRVKWRSHSMVTYIRFLSE